MIFWKQTFKIVMAQSELKIRGSFVKNVRAGTSILVLWYRYQFIGTSGSTGTADAGVRISPEVE